MAEKVFVSYEQMERYVDALVMHLKEKKIKASGVYGIPKGGLVFAVMIANRLDIPLLMAPAQNCIVVDDIADSGRTLLHFRENDTQFNKYFITTMFYHKRSMIVPDFFMFEKGDKWIEFCYEKKD